MINVGSLIYALITHRYKKTYKVLFQYKDRLFQEFLLYNKKVRERITLQMLSLVFGHVAQEGRLVRLAELASTTVTWKFTTIVSLDLLTLHYCNLRLALDLTKNGRYQLRNAVIIFCLKT